VYKRQAQAEEIVACDFFTVETIWLKTLHVLFFVQLSTRGVVAVGVAANPDSAWSPSRPGMLRWASTIGEDRSGSCSATTTPGSLVLR